MLICLIREIAGSAPASGKQTPGTVFQTAQLTIGSAPDQHLQVPHKNVDPQHAVLRLTSDGRLVLTGLGAKGIVVNGRRQTRATLYPNDVLKLGDTTVSAIMTPRSAIDAVPVDATFDQVRNLVLAKGHSRIPVYEESIDRIIGVIYAKDLLRVRTPEAFAMRKWMRRAPYVPETKSVNDLL